MKDLKANLAAQAAAIKQSAKEAEAKKTASSRSSAGPGPEITILDRELTLSYAETRKRWDNFVLSKKEEIFARLLVALEPFFGGPEKASLTRREFENMHVPARDALDRAYSPDFHNPDATAADRREWAEFLIAHIERACSRFGWGDPEAILAAPVRRDVPQSRFSAPPRKVKVRALETVPIPALGERKDEKGRPTSVIKAGTVMEISETDYKALSRFFALA